MVNEVKYLKKVHNKCWISMEIILNDLFFLFTLSGCWCDEKLLVVFRCQQYLLLNSHCLSLHFKFTAGRHQFVFRDCSYDSDLFDSLKQTILTSDDPKQYFGWFSSPKKVFLESWMSHSFNGFLTHPNKPFWHLMTLSYFDISCS